MKKRLSITILCFLISILATGQTKYQSKQEIEEVRNRIDSVLNNTLLPAQELTDLKGNKLSFEQFKGKTVVLDLWATWCKPCIAQSPYFESRNKELSNDSLVFISISLDKDFERWVSYSNKHPVNYIRYWVGDNQTNPFYWLTYDEYDMMGATVWASGIPRFVLIGKKGKVVDNNLGYPSERKFKKKIKKQN